jgi:hypothetical protein
VVEAHEIYLQAKYLLTTEDSPYAILLVKKFGVADSATVFMSLTRVFQNNIQLYTIYAAPTNAQFTNIKILTH